MAINSAQLRPWVNKIMVFMSCWSTLKSCQNIKLLSHSMKLNTDVSTSSNTNKKAQL